MKRLACPKCLETWTADVPDGAAVRCPRCGKAARAPGGRGARPLWLAVAGAAGVFAIVIGLGIHAGNRAAKQTPANHPGALPAGEAGTTGAHRLVEADLAAILTSLDSAGVEFLSPTANDIKRESCAERFAASVRAVAGKDCVLPLAVRHVDSQWIALEPASRISELDRLDAQQRFLERLRRGYLDEPRVPPAVQLHFFFQAAGHEYADPEVKPEHVRRYLEVVGGGRGSLQEREEAAYRGVARERFWLDVGPQLNRLPAEVIPAERLARIDGGSTLTVRRRILSATTGLFIRPEPEPGGFHTAGFTKILLIVDVSSVDP